MPTRYAVTANAQMGYGTRALQLLSQYYSGQFTNLDESAEPSKGVTRAESAMDISEVPRPRENLPPLLEELTHRRAEALQYLGTSFGITDNLYQFWCKNGFNTVYVRQTCNNLTGEHSCIMLKELDNSTTESDWLSLYSADFRKRFMYLSALELRTLSAALAFYVLDPAKSMLSVASRGTLPPGIVANDKSVEFSYEELSREFSEYDLRRLESYSKNLVDYHMILDLVTPITRLVFLRRMKITMSYTQAVIFVGMGIQMKTVTDMENELQLPSSQILALFNKVVRKVVKYVRKIQETEMKKELPEVSAAAEAVQTMQSSGPSLRTELAEEEKNVAEELKRKQRALLESMNLDQYAIGGTEAEWNGALSNHKTPSAISIKSDGSKKRPKKESAEESISKKKSKKSKKKHSKKSRT